MPLLAAVGACLLAGVAATWFLTHRRLPRKRRIAGRELLAAMDPGDFMQLVLAVLNGRGYERAFGGSGTEDEYLLEHHGQRWLLSSRHARAYAPGSTVIAEFSSYLRQRGIDGGLLAIPGRFPRGAFGLARAHRIELLDGASMWDELQPLLDDAQHAAIERPARARLRWQFALAWLAAIAIGAAVYLGLGAWGKPAAEAFGVSAVPATPVAAPAPPLRDSAPGSAGAPVPAASAPAAAATPAATTAPSNATDATQEISIQARRRTIANAIGRLPHVRSAAWPMPSTLQVVVDSDLFDPRSSLCPLIEDDPDLGASRLQVQYPASSERPVRFLQCRAY